MANSTTKIFIIAGEESGDIHGAKLVNEINRLNPSVKFIGHGGDKMQAAGVEIIEHISKLSLVGLTEVVKHLPYIKRVMKNTIKLIKDIMPSRIILIDYPGFNLRIAKKIQNFNIPVTYFILPQVWAWNEKRAYQIQKLTEQALSIIPFEKEWFAEHKISIDYVGHPFAEIEKQLLTKQEFFQKHNLELEKPLLILLPGSRQQEIDRHWPIFTEVVNKLHNTFPNIQFIIGKAPNVKILNIPEFIKIESEDVRVAMQYGTAGLIASGTATLEAAVLGLPTVVCYKTSRITHWVGKRLAKVKYLSLVNLIGERQIVPELLQDRMIPELIIKALVPLLSDTPEREKMTSGYSTVKAKLGEPGVYQRTASLIYDKLNA